MDPTNKTFKIKIGGKEHTLHFNLNTFEKFEENCGTLFLDFLLSMQKAMAEAPTEKMVNPKTGREELLPDFTFVLQKLSIRHVRALLHAALHDYDAKDDPIWPYSIGRLGRMVDAGEIAALIPTLWDGANSNMPERKEGAEEAERPTNGAISPLAASSGGNSFGPSDDAVLGSIELN